MGAISGFVKAFGEVVSQVRFLANTPRTQLIKQLDALVLNLEQFRDAARTDDVSKMRELVAECAAETRMLEQRVFMGLDEKTSESLRQRLKRAHHAKAKRAKLGRQAQARRRVAAKRAKLAQANLKAKLKLKRTKLADAIAADDKRKREKLIAEIDTAIGELRGIAKSLDSFKI